MSVEWKRREAAGQRSAEAAIAAWDARMWPYEPNTDDEELKRQWRNGNYLPALALRPDYRGPLRESERFGEVFGATAYHDVKTGHRVALNALEAGETAEQNGAVVLYVFVAGRDVSKWHVIRASDVRSHGRPCEMPSNLGTGIPNGYEITDHDACCSFDDVYGRTQQVLC